MITEKRLKRFWLFLFDRYDAKGGMEDFVDSYSTLEEAIEDSKINNRGYDSVSIYDSKESKIVYTK